MADNYSTKCRARSRRSKIILVLDIDETLVHSKDKSESGEFHDLCLQSDPTKLTVRSSCWHLRFKNSEMWSLKRPYLDKFINFALHTFDKVIVWSAGTYQYVHKVVKFIFRGTCGPDLILCRDNCVKVDDVWTKPLTELDKYIPGINLDHVLIIDDRSDVCEDNPNNAIIVEKYKPKSSKDKSFERDDTLKRLIDYFNRPEVLTCDDVRKLEINL